MLIAGGLDYGSPSSSTGKRILRSGYSWNYLPATRTESAEIATLAKTASLEVTRLEARDFVDSLLPALNDYRFIHLATHGFYLDSAESVKTYASHLQRNVYKLDPLYRCGLAISGANEYYTRSDEDGYLMGYELANTDLRNCELISLSACET